jgi:hypothetical protein
MKKVLGICFLVLLALAASSYAEPRWCHGQAVNYTTGVDLGGWTIQCGGGTYGSNVADTVYGDFGLSYSLHPVAGYYYFTADSGSTHWYSSKYYYYDGSSYNVEYGTVRFRLQLPPAPRD